MSSLIKPLLNYPRLPVVSILTKSLSFKMDPVQASLLAEPCILVDNQDQVLGSASKEVCHRWDSIKQTCPLHRAFSVFLFNSQKELLLQRRSLAKITFPGYYTNTCCSHPLHVPAEMEIEGHFGIKRAAKRRLKEELGIEDIQPEDFRILTRVHYQAQSGESSQWGEHEIDYILFAQKEVALKPNPNEIMDIRYISLDGLKAFVEEMKERRIPLTPWFELILNYKLTEWWHTLDELNKLTDDGKIHKL